MTPKHVLTFLEFDTSTIVRARVRVIYFDELQKSWLVKKTGWLSLPTDEIFPT